MSLHQPSLDLSPASSPLFSDVDEPSVIPGTPPGVNMSSSRNLLPNFCSARDRREREVDSSPSVSSEDLANELPGWYRTLQSGSSSNLSTPSSTASSRSHSSLEKRTYATTTPSPGSSNSSADNLLLKQILMEVQESNKKVADLENQLKDLQDSGSGKSRSRKISPSPEVRMMVRKVFKTLEEEDENFGWSIRVRFADQANQVVANKLVTEVKAHLPDVPSVTIKDAARTYFNSVLGVSRLKTCGKYDTKIAHQRRKNRQIRKLKKRQWAFLKTSALNKEQKEKWKPCMIAEMMSSEESDDNDGDEESPKFVVRPLPWRSNKVNSFLSSLDSKTSKSQSKKSAMMTIQRSKGLPSDRPRPASVPDWALKPPPV